MGVDARAWARFFAMSLTVRFAVALSLAGLLVAWPLSGLTMSSAPEGCRQETSALSGMGSTELAIMSPEGQIRWSTQIRIAQTADQRAAGMQHLCPEVVRENPMLFVFPRPVKPQFHMSNVHVALDILFLDEDRRIVEIARMPMGPQLVGPSAPIRYALELAEGEIKRHGVRVGDRLRWN